MDYRLLIWGLVSLLAGLIGRLLKPLAEKEPKGSVTRAHVIWDTYILLAVGIILVIWSFFSE
jgi:hypothetical protein